MSLWQPVVFMLFLAALGAVVLLWFYWRKELNKNQELLKDISRLNLENGQYQGRLQELEKSAQTLETQRKQLVEAVEAVHQKSLKVANEDLEKRANQSLKNTLDPYAERIQNLKQQLEQQLIDAGKERAVLTDSFKKQVEANHKFTQAITHQSKTRGNFGEQLLQRALESVGLVNGHNFHLQYSVEGAEGQRQVVDCVVVLPEGRKIIIDAKYPIKAWMDYCDESEQDQPAQIKNLTKDLRKYIDEMSERNYPAAISDALDFTLLFIPVEAAVSTALDGDASLFDYAWKKQVGLVSHTMLLPTIRIVENLWKVSLQQKSQQELVKAVEQLWDKFAASYKDFAKLGGQIVTVQKSYDSAEKKLVSGRKNLVSQFQGLKKYGIQGSKPLPGTEDYDDEPEAIE